LNASLQILLCIALVIAAAKLTGNLASRFGLPVVLGEVLAGLLLGPTAFNVWQIPWLTRPPTPDSASVLTIFKILAEIGVVVLMFVAGLETDLSMMRRTVAAAFWAGLGGVVLPMLGGYFVSRWFGLTPVEAIFIGTILTATSVTITVQTLRNLGQLQSKVGATILGAAVIDDVLGLVVLSVVVALAPRMAHTGLAVPSGLAVTLARMVVCLAAIVLLGPVLAKWAMKYAARLHGDHTEAAVALAVALALAFLAQWGGGMAAITGAYLAGLFVAMTPEREQVIVELHPMLNSFFGPLFFVSIGMEVNAWHLGGSFIFFALIFGVAVAGKVLGSGLGARCTGFDSREALAVGIGMVPRGEVGLIAASLGLAAGLVTREIYAQAVALVLLTTLITPALLRYALPKMNAQAVSDTPASLPVP
jgi:Kef-type K+ transport system membrane component KefB